MTQCAVHHGEENPRRSAQAHNMQAVLPPEQFLRDRRAPGDGATAWYSNRGIEIRGLASIIRGCFAMPHPSSRDDPRLVFAGGNGSKVEREILALMCDSSAPSPDELDARVAANVTRHTIVHLAMLAISRSLWDLAERAVRAAEGTDAAMLLFFICHHGLHRCIEWCTWRGMQCTASEVVDYFEFECAVHPRDLDPHILRLDGPSQVHIYDCITTGKRSDASMARTLRAYHAIAPTDGRTYATHRASYPANCARALGPHYTIAAHELLLGDADPAGREGEFRGASHISVAFDSATFAAEYGNMHTAWALARRWPPARKCVSMPCFVEWNVSADTVNFMATYFCHSEEMAYRLLAYMPRGARSHATDELAKMALDRISLPATAFDKLIMHVLVDLSRRVRTIYVLLTEHRRLHGATASALRLRFLLRGHGYYPRQTLYYCIARHGIQPSATSDSVWRAGHHHVHLERTAALVTLANLKGLGSVTANGTKMPVDLLELIGDYVALPPATEPPPGGRVTRSRTAVKRAMNGTGRFVKRARYEGAG